VIARRALLAFAVVAVAVPCVAQTAVPGPAAAIEALNDALLLVMKAGHGVPFATRMAMLTPVIERVFDLPTLLENSVGPAKWAVLPAGQKAELLDAFTAFTVSSYVGNFDAFNGESFTILPELRHVGRDVVVATRLTGTGGDLTKIDYQLREANGGWKVVDILLDGAISRVAVTRSDFRSLLAQNDAAPLIASLRAKSASLAAGATN
jgi:phospholipid transport system substrate-binding protein